MGSEHKTATNCGGTVVPPQRKKGRRVSLKVVQQPPARQTPRPSKNSGRRAAVLATITALMVLHLFQWLHSRQSASGGRTLSPIEPSEAMYTLQSGEVNAGFFFFLLLLVGTFVFGRFFCGWGCHIVALQDLCQWMMKKIGIKPRPFRSRLMLWGPLLLGLYMFVWPAFERHVVPLVLKWTGLTLPKWITPVVPFPGFKAHYVVDNLWKTFPPWYVAVPFLLACGFAAVYFLGAKGFCTYGCPYGGFFAHLDRVSPGRIVVSDACEECGHCTAACTSNVVVHREVRDYGMVVDPGCMKCLDCVSVCPNDALSFSFAKPAVLTHPRVEVPGPASRFDLTWPQELWVAAAGLFLFWAFHDMFDRVALLMASGMAAIGAFFAWKLWATMKLPNVRIQNLELKEGGKVSAAGWGFVAVAVVYLAMGAWSAQVKANLFWGGVLQSRVEVPIEAALSPGYQAKEEDKAAALRALAVFKRTLSPIGDGGYGWEASSITNVRMSWLATAAGDLPLAQSYLERAIDAERPVPDLVFGLAMNMELQGRSSEEITAMYQRVLERYPELHPLRLKIATQWLKERQPERAIGAAEQVISMTEEAVDGDRAFARAAEILMRAGRLDRGMQLIEAAVARTPGSAAIHEAWAMGFMLRNQPDRAVDEAKEAVRLEPEEVQLLNQLAALLEHLGRGAEAAEYKARIAEVERRRGESR